MKLIRKIWDWTLTLMFFAAIASAVAWLDHENSQQIAGQVRVIDGDSLHVDGREIRLMGIDAPEYQQICTRKGAPWRCGIASRNALRDMTKRGRVVCRASSVDQYDRWLGECSVGDTVINRAMVEQGWAVDFGGYASHERTARSAKRGIWQSDFQRPRDWREAHRGSAADGASAKNIALGWYDRVKAWFSF